MAITRRYQARATVSPETHSQLVLASKALLAQHVEIIDQAAHADGTVEITFAGQGLGKTAVPLPPPCAVRIVDGVPSIQLVE